MRLTYAKVQEDTQVIFESGKLVELFGMYFDPDSYDRQSFGLAIWKSKESNNAFFASQDYARIRADKDAALRHLDVWQGKIVIQ